MTAIKNEVLGKIEVFTQEMGYKPNILIVSVDTYMGLRRDEGEDFIPSYKRKKCDGDVFLGLVVAVLQDHHGHELRVGRT